MKMYSILLGLMLISTGAYAGDKEKKHEKGEFLKKELGLTDEQLSEIQTIRKSGKSVKEKKTLFITLRKELRSDMLNSKSTEVELNEKFAAFQKARQDFESSRFNMMMKMRKVLSPEQLIKFNALKDKKKDKKKKK